MKTKQRDGGHERTGWQAVVRRDLPPPSATEKPLCTTTIHSLVCFVRAGCDGACRHLQGGTVAAVQPLLYSTSNGRPCPVRSAGSPELRRQRARPARLPSTALDVCRSDSPRAPGQMLDIPVATNSTDTTGSVLRAACCLLLLLLLMLPLPLMPHLRPRECSGAPHSREQDRTRPLPYSLAAARSKARQGKARQISP